MITNKYMYSILYCLFPIIIFVKSNGNLTNKEKYKNLKIYLSSIKESCGNVCDQSLVCDENTKCSAPIEKTIDCTTLFKNSDIDSSSEFDYPPHKIPKWMVPEYDYGGRVPIFYHYRDDSRKDDDSKSKNIKLLEDRFGNIHWGANLIKWIETQIRGKTFEGPYGRKSIEDIESIFQQRISLQGLNVLVIGSEGPWIEVLALIHGAETVTSVDYGKIKSDDSRILVMTHKELEEKFLNGTATKFDVVISYSSLEHSGLGRYGDRLNPWGDLIAMAKAWCLSKPTGKAVIGIPVGPSDKIVFNSHKTYGPIMRSHLFANWKLEYTNLDLNLYNDKFYPSQANDHESLKHIVEEIKDKCGSVCDTDLESDLDGKYYNQLWKNIDCKAMFKHSIFDRLSMFSRPIAIKDLPKSVKDEFTYQGKLQMKPLYADNSKLSNYYEKLPWTVDKIETMQDKFRKGEQIGLYDQENVDDIVYHLQQYMNVKNKHVLVIGTQEPWIEAILLEFGANKITILEYNDIVSEHHQLFPIKPRDFAEKYLNGTLEPFDAMVTFSSIEHSGLGTYGDGINPWADLITMARAWCTLKPKAKALVGVPYGPDVVQFNNLRVYGPILHSHLFSNWCQIHRGPILRPYEPTWSFRNQPVHVIEKISNISEEAECFDV